MPKRTFQPKFKPLGDFFESLLVICQQNVNSFCEKHFDKYETSYTTLYMIQKAKAAPTNETLWWFALAFAEELDWCVKVKLINNLEQLLNQAADWCKPGLKISLEGRDLADELFLTFCRLYPRPNAELVADRGPFCIDTIDAEGFRGQIDLFEKPDSTLLLRHWSLLTESDRLSLLPKLLQDTTRSIENFHLELDSSGLADRLAISIRSTMREWGISTTDRFADRVLEEYEVKESHRDAIKKSIVEAVRSIVELKQTPETQDPAFSGAMGYLAGVLEGERFDGDVVAMLTFFAKPNRVAVGK